MTGTPDLFRLGGAELSQDGRFRYRLWRTVGPVGDGEAVVFVGLNPSIADAVQDDPTLRRCMGFARAWGYRRVELVNLWALRATDPAVLLAPTPPGVSARARNGGDARCDEAIRTAVATTERVVCAWGAYRVVRNRQLGKRVAEVLAMVPADKRFCLGTTKDGHPRHPLYLAADTPYEPYRRTCGRP